MPVKLHFDVMEYKIALSLSRKAQSKTLKLSSQKMLPENQTLHLSIVRLSGIFWVNLLLHVNVWTANVTFVNKMLVTSTSKQKIKRHCLTLQEKKPSCNIFYDQDVSTLAIELLKKYLL